VALCLPNHPAVPILCNAIWLAGGVVVATNPLNAQPSIQQQFADCSPRFVFTTTQHELAAKVRAAAGDGATVLAVDASGASAFDMSRPTDALAELASSASGKLADLPRISPEEDLAVLQYTGGTTGTPKGAVLTHGNLSRNLAQMRCALDRLDYGAERFLAAAPFSHIIGLSSVLAFGQSIAAELVIVTRFHAEETTRLILDRRLSYIVGVPTMYNAMLQTGLVAQADWSFVKYPITGGAPLPDEIANRFLAVTGHQLLPGYGLSETSPAVALMPYGAIAPQGATGRPLAGTFISIRCIDDPKVAMPRGERGEICVSGPQVMQGYWHRPEESRAAFIDGWFRTGDIGLIDGEGYLHVVDRLKDIIIASGFNVYPARVEAAIYQHPGIVEAAVIGEPDPYRGETVKAVVALAPGALLTLIELQTFLRDKLSPIEMPKLLQIVDQLPKSPAGKILRRELRTQA
jgi:long-chain acyl-CoA synthetase